MFSAAETLQKKAMTERTGQLLVLNRGCGAVPTGHKQHKPEIVLCTYSKIILLKETTSESLSNSFYLNVSLT